jgi:hypothetical protein
MYQYDYSTLQPVRSSGHEMVGSACWPTTTSGETMDKIKAWLNKPTLASHPTIKNWHVGVGVAAVVGVGLLARHNRWI